MQGTGARQIVHEKVAIDQFNPRVGVSAGSLSDKMTMQDIQFGISNAAGDSVLLLVGDTSNVENLIANPSKFDKLIYTGQAYNIAFIEKTFNSDYSGISQCFSEINGYLFKVTGNPIKVGKYFYPQTEPTAVLTTKSFLANRPLIKTKDLKNTKLSSSIKQQVEAEKGRKIKQYKSLLALDGAGQTSGSFYLVEFYPKGSSKLVSLVFISSNKLIYKDFPGQGDYNLWSFERKYISEGVYKEKRYFPMDSFRILGVFSNQAHIEVVVELGTFFDADDNSQSDLSLQYIRERGSKFETLKTGSRHTGGC